MFAEAAPEAAEPVAVAAVADEATHQA